MTDSLNGALETLGELMADNLTQQGVSAWASDGLTTLANKILDISGGSCYHLELSEHSVTTTGTFTISATLQEDYQLKSGATVTFTGGTSTVTATTDSNGVATATVTFTGDGTLTATYGNVSDTCSVTVQSYLFYDDCSIDRSSEYTKVSNYCSFTYDSSGYYVLTKTSSSGTSGVKINSTQFPKNVKITVDIQMKNSGNLQPKLVFMDTTQTYGYVPRLTYTNGKGSIINGSFTSEGTSITGDITVSQSLNTWYTFEFIKNGTNLTFNIYNTTNGTLIKSITGTGSRTFSDNANSVGMAVSYDSGKYFWFKNLKVEAL